jgi:3-oxoacyl-[acyl-carrier-protein] synthase III
MRFLAVEHQLPRRCVTNDEVIARVREASAKHLGPAVLDELEALIRACFRSTGTAVRYHREEREQAVELAASAGERALAAAGLSPLDIDLLIYVGIGRGMMEPASATIFQDVLGLRRATAFDVLDACASWVRALQIAHAFLASGAYANVMVMNAEFVGRDGYRYELRSLAEFAHWHPTVTIGEAATACVVSPSGEPDEFETDFRTWGEKRDLCFVPLPNVEGYFGKALPADLDLRPLEFVSYGLRLMDFGARKLIGHYRERPQYGEFDPDVVFGHAASDGMSVYVLDECGIDRRRFQFTHHRFANTVSASVPLAMSHALKAGELADGHRVLVLTASAGVTTALTKFVFHHPGSAA